MENHSKNLLLKRLQWVTKKVIENKYFTALSAFKLIENDIEHLIELNKNTLNK